MLAVRGVTMFETRHAAPPIELQNGIYRFGSRILCRAADVGRYAKSCVRRKLRQMEPTRIELATPALQRQCSPN